MNKLTAFMALAGLLFNLHAEAAAARPVTVGPSEDMHVLLPIKPPPGGGVVAHTVLHPNPGTPFWTDRGAIKWFELTDLSWLAARGVGYVTAPSGDFGKGQLTVTTIFGHDLNPGGAELVIGGYSPAAPEVTYGTHEVYGRSGKAYPPQSSQLVPIGNLAAVLGPGFDLSPFVGDPALVVQVFQTIAPAKDSGPPIEGILMKEDFADSPHVGRDNGAFGSGFDLIGSSFRVTRGNVDVLGSLNGVKGRCVSNPNGNCLDLIGNADTGEVRSMNLFNLSPAYKYIVQFNVIAQDVGGDMRFLVSLGDHFTQQVTASSTVLKVGLTYTPTTDEPWVDLAFSSVDNLDGVHGPVISNVVVCALPADSAKSKCPVR